MSKPYLSKTHTRNFNTLNSYTRTLGKDGHSTNKESWDSWECRFTGENVGCSYEEDKQSYKRLLAHDEKHGTEYADYYANFHELWYWDGLEPDWSTDLRNSRRKDVFLQDQRVDLLSATKTLSEITDDTVFLEATHNPSMGLEFMEKSSEEIVEKKPKTRYSTADYQFTINPLSPRWADLLITRIDQERGVKEDVTELDAGIVFLKRGQSRWGFNSPYQGLWIVTVLFPNSDANRVATMNKEQAQKILEELRQEYAECAFSVEPEEYFFMK